MVWAIPRGRPVHVFDRLTEAVVEEYISIGDLEYRPAVQYRPGGSTEELWGKKLQPLMGTFQGGAHEPEG